LFLQEELNSIFCLGLSRFFLIFIGGVERSEGVIEVILKWEKMSKKKSKK